MKNFILYSIKTILNEEGMELEEKLKIAEGVEFTNKKCVVCWINSPCSVVVWDSLEHMMAINCNGDSREIVYLIP